jgi:endo-1,4-beta-xylanase
MSIQNPFMKYRLFLAFVVFVLVSLLMVLRVNSTSATPTASPTPVPETSGTALRSLGQKQGIGIGTAVDVIAFKNDPNYRKVLAREFNILVPENAWKFQEIHPQRHRYNFVNIDALAEFAKANNMKLRGHPLVWHYSLPAWLEKGNFSRDELIEILRDHIQTVVGRYRGQVSAWDVVNEAINRDGSLRDTIWLRVIGPEYIDMAYHWAHEADPDALLLYGEYMIEEINLKSDGVYALVSGLKQRGVPLDGVGIQGHLGLSYLPDWDALEKNFERFNQLGLDVQFTELDIKIHDGQGSWDERLIKQAQAYRNIFQTCLQAKKCSGMVMWGFTDRYTWATAATGQNAAPLIFDESYRPKPAYLSVQEVLSSQ